MLLCAKQCCHSLNYQVFFAGAKGLHWMVNVGRYRTVGESLQKNSQDIILIPNTIVSIVNVVGGKYRGEK
jgi:hypothetical protein